MVKNIWKSLLLWIYSNLVNTYLWKLLLLWIYSNLVITHKHYK